VATPLRWEEVEGALEDEGPESIRFEAGEVTDRLNERIELFEPVLSMKQKLPDVGQAS
jgi:bifunctional non-homologous end joining protein LigD